MLIPRGRIAHSRFVIPINVDENSTCNIKQGSSLVELIAKAKLIIWDEVSMIHKHYFEAIDGAFMDILRFVNYRILHFPFGGKVVILGGNFRQILLIIPKEIKQVLHSTINSYLWNFCEILT